MEEFKGYPPIVAFFHIATIGCYQEIVSEIMQRVISSGLYERLDALYIGIVGAGEVDGIKMPKLKIVVREPDTKRFEFPTLEKLQLWAIENPDGRVLYIHTKGASATGRAVAVSRDWRRYMLHFVVDRHADCLERLATSQACGVDVRNELGAGRHFSGNFWWAQADHIGRLPLIETISAPEALWTISRRHNAEFWIGMRDGLDLTCLFDSTIGGPERYSRRFPPCCYRDRNSLGLVGKGVLRWQRMWSEIVKLKSVLQKQILDVFWSAAWRIVRAKRHICGRRRSKKSAR